MPVLTTQQAISQYLTHYLVSHTYNTLDALQAAYPAIDVAQYTTPIALSNQNITQWILKSAINHAVNTQHLVPDQYDALIDFLNGPRKIIKLNQFYCYLDLTHTPYDYDQF